ncbi:hypothetical protein GCM10028799_43580 [Kribbella italica]
MVGSDVFSARFESLGFDENRAGAAEWIQDNLAWFEAGQLGHGGGDRRVQAAWDGVLSPVASVERRWERPDANVY